MIIYFIIILAITTRFIPHMPNFAPITALAIFSAANMDWKKSAALTLAVRFISDLFLGLFSWPLMAAVYACHLAGVLLGVVIKNTTSSIPSTSEESLNLSYILGKGIPHSVRDGTQKWLKIVGSSLFASILFFLVTNFAFFYSTYSHDFSGIMQAYVNGLPFFRGTLLGDLSYTVALFGAYDLAKAAVYLKAKTKLLTTSPCKKVWTLSVFPWSIFAMTARAILSWARGQ